MTTEFFLKATHHKASQTAWSMNAERKMRELMEQAQEQKKEQQKEQQKQQKNNKK